MPLRMVTWNTEWATPRSRRAPEILSRIDQLAPDVACLTEVDDRLLSRDGYTITAQSDYGYSVKAGRRKVVLWSRQPWTQVDDVGIPSMPPGRFISGVTRTPIGDTTVVGVCIPWSGSRTESYRASGRKTRWEDHESYLGCLATLLEGMPAERLVVVGDFNQIVGPGSRAPKRLQTALRQAFPAYMTIATADLSFQGRRSIDHIVLSNDLAVGAMDVISNVHDGESLSDHFGVAVTVTAGPLN